MSKNVSSTWADCTPRSRRYSSEVRYSRPWPTALAPCSSSIARGRTGSPSTCIPRAIAPEVTTTTSTPASCSNATSSHTRATTASRSAPESSATTAEPSLTTATGTAGSLDGRARVQLEDDAADLHVVAGLESCSLQRGDDAHALQPALHVGLRLLVLHVEAGDQALDRLAADHPRAVRRPGDRELARGRRAEHGIVGHLVLPRALRRRRGDRDAPQQLPAQLGQPRARGGRGQQHGKRHPLRPL